MIFATTHAVEALELLYPRVDGKLVQQEISNGIPVHRDVALRLLGRAAARDGRDMSGYVLHRERTGIFCLVENGVCLPDPVDTADPQRTLTVVTFLRFYAFDQHQLATRLYGKGDPVTANVRWRHLTAEPAPAPTLTRVSPVLPAAIKKKKKAPTPPSPTVHVSDGLAKALGGRERAKQLLGRETLPEEDNAEIVLDAVPVLLRRVRRDLVMELFISCVPTPPPPPKPRAEPKVPTPADALHMSRVNQLRKELSGVVIPTIELLASELRIGNGLLPRESKAATLHRWRLRGAVLSVPFEPTEYGYQLDILLDGVPQRVWLANLGGEWWLLDNPGSPIDAEQNRLADVLRAAGWRVYPPVPNSKEFADAAEERSLTKEM